MKFHTRRGLLAAGAALCCPFGAPAQIATVGIVDTAFSRGSDGVFFIVTAVDGKETRNALGESLAASRGQGRNMRVVGFRRQVPTGKVRLALKGIQSGAAPIQAIFRSLSGDPPQVEGSAEYELVAGAIYRVNGAVDDFRRQVWLEDELGRVIGPVFKPPLTPAVAKAMEGAAFVKTNLRYDGDWIDDEPRIGLPTVPPGARLKVVSFGKQRADVLIDGRKMRIGVEYGTETIQQLVARLTEPEDPRPRIAGWPEAVRSAVAAGRVMRGMSREQVATALGRPRPDLVGDAAAGWPYKTADDDAVTLGFGADGTLDRIEGPPSALSRLVHEPPAAAPTASGAAAPAAASAPN